MRSHKAHLGLAIVIVIVLVFGASSPTAAQQPVRIGASMALTGKYALQGGYGRDGYQLCQKHLNAQGGVLGRPVEFVICDDASEEKTAVGVYEKLITEDGVDAVIGPYSSPITLPVTYYRRICRTAADRSPRRLNDYRSWEPQMSSLSSRLRVLAVSLRHYYPERWNGKGNDFSEKQHAEDVTTLIERLGTGSVYLVGH
jgi:hypothetical protein